MTKEGRLPEPMRRYKLKRDINDDNLTQIERDILTLLKDRGVCMSVKEIAFCLLGSDVSAEARGETSVRTIRNALRIPKAMGLISHTNLRGTYIITESFSKFGFQAAEKTAAAWKARREERRRRRKEESDES